MDLHWEPLALPGMVAGVAELGLAWLVFSSRPDRPQNRILAVLLLLGSVLIGGMYGARLLFADPRDAMAMYSVGLVVAYLWAWAYLAFLGTIESSLSKPLRAPAARWSLGLLFVPLAAAAAWLGVTTAEPFATFNGWSVLTNDALGRIAYLFYAIWAYGIAVAVTAYRSARTPASRRQNAWYMAAFIVQDGILFAWMALGFVGLGSAVIDRTTFLLPALAMLGLEVLLAYGILRTQLFDIDLKIKWTINRGAFVGAFLATFFIATVTAENFLTDQYGWAVGGVAAGLMLFALAPLQRFADRVADAAMPRVRDTDAYRNVRKREVYRAAYESAAHDGDVTDRERDVLATLADQLGLSAGDARAVERDAAAALRA